MTEAPRTLKRRWALTGLVALAVFSGAMFRLLQRAEPPPVVILSADAPLKLQQPLLSRWIPASWGWLRGLRYAAFGYPKSYAIQSTVLEVGTNAHGSLAQLALPAPACQTNGVQFWYLPTNKIAEIKKHFEQHGDIRASPGIATGQGALVRMFTGQTMPINGVPTDIGWQFECVATSQHTGTDLALRLVTSSFGVTAEGTNISLYAVTNISLAARLQIPKRHGVLLVHQKDTNALAMLVVGEWKAPKGK